MKRKKLENTLATPILKDSKTQIQNLLEGQQIPGSSEASPSTSLWLSLWQAAPTLPAAPGVWSMDSPSRLESLLEVLGLPFFVHIPWRFDYKQGLCGGQRLGK